MKLLLLFVLLAAAAGAATVLTPVQRVAAVNPRHTFAEWVDILEAAEERLPEECDGCQPGTQPQPDVAGLSSAAEPGRPRVIGGSEAVAGQFPWQAQVHMDSGWFCGGSVVSAQWILTAGHCASGYRQFKVVLGSLFTASISESNRQTFLTREAHVHEKYDISVFLNDIAVVKLPGAGISSWTTFIRPVLLPSFSQAKESLAGQPVSLSGYGRYGTSSVSPFISPVLRWVNLNVITNAECAKAFGSIVHPSIICTDGGTRNGPLGSCNGDSGGPLTIAINGAAVEVGIVSYGSSGGCNIGYPNGYTRVTSFLEWISDKTGILIRK